MLDRLNDNMNPWELRWRDERAENDAMRKDFAALAKFVALRLGLTGREEIAAFIRERGVHHDR